MNWTKSGSTGLDTFATLSRGYTAPKTAPDVLNFKFEQGNEMGHIYVLISLKSVYYHGNLGNLQPSVLSYTEKKG